MEKEALSGISSEIAARQAALQFIFTRLNLLLPIIGGVCTFEVEALTELDGKLQVKRLFNRWPWEKEWERYTAAEVTFQQVISGALLEHYNAQRQECAHNKTDLFRKALDAYDAYCSILNVLYSGLADDPPLER